MKYKVSLSIGFAGEGREDELDVDDNELASCETEKQKQDLLHQYWLDWSADYIDGGIYEA